MDLRVAGFKGASKEPTTVDRVVLTLRQAILDGYLASGTQLREEMLSQRFAVSRGTVREALRVLVVDGLMQRQPNRSVVVRHLTLSEVKDIYRARLVLESASVRAAATCPDEALAALTRLLATYEAEVTAGNPSRAAGAHVEFHANMVQILSDSAWLAEAERSMLHHLLLIFATVHRSGEDLIHEIGLHRDLVELCSARRIEEALACLKEGLDDSKAFAIRLSGEAVASDPPQE